MVYDEWINVLGVVYKFYVICREESVENKIKDG